MKWAFIVFFVYVISLFFRSERIPGEWVEKAVSRHLPTNLVFHCESVSLNLRHGLDIHGLRIYDLDRHEPITPAFAASSVTVAILERRVKVVEARFPRLHDSYYEPGPYAEPLGYDEIDINLPALPEFSLELERPSILGVEPERVTAQVFMRSRGINLSGLNIEWPSRERKMSLNGSFLFDIAGKRVSGKVQGLATQSQIRPLLVVLDLPSALPYMDAFTGVTAPVPVSCAWDVNLFDNEFRLDLGLRPVLGAYNGVPMSYADGGLSIHTTFPVRDGVRRMDYAVTVGPLQAFDSKDRPLAGKITVNGFGGAKDRPETVHIDFDAASSLPKDDMLAIIDYLNDGILDSLVCDAPPTVKVRGTMATDVAHQSDNDLLGSISFASGSLFGTRLHDVSCNFAYVGDRLSFFDASARGRDGGTVSGSAHLSLPELDPDRASYTLDITYAGGNLGELADMVNLDPGDRNGDVECALHLSGPMATNSLDRLNGSGYIKISNGHLAQMNLFMGLTRILADEVPGVDQIVNQSEASATFFIENGILRSRDVLIEGALFSISGVGEYDIARDNLDFVVRVQIMRKDSILGKYLLRPILWPFTKLLLEFRLSGSAGNPEWNYISVLDRVL